MGKIMRDKMEKFIEMSATQLVEYEARKRAKKLRRKMSRAKKRGVAICAPDGL